MTMNRLLLVKRSQVYDQCTKFHHIQHFSNRTITMNKRSFDKIGDALNSQERINKMPKISKQDLAISQRLPELAELIDEQLSSISDQRTGFALVVFNGKAGTRINYISNCEQENVDEALQTLLDGWKNNMPDIPFNKIN